MIVQMKRQQFAALTGQELIAACTEPMIVQFRSGDMSVKLEVMSRLNKEQQALCMFRLLYPAAHSPEEFGAWMAYLLEQPGYWTGILGGVRFFDETALLRLLEEIERLATEHRSTAVPHHAGTVQSVLSPLFQSFADAMNDSIERISLYIRSDPQQFVALVD
ncbi:hypothetical protein ACFFNY_27860 [Paenibacillus hodogayensis]|uniref:Uncharacterized protein n=1 Tax=Paenibacillus hodogayensis TaxID=279208 RepID=A0ABV5W4D6_9BACL